ncbi:MAG: peptide deformylase [Candidatus Dojkabacteria bacterium]
MVKKILQVKDSEKKLRERSREVTLDEILGVEMSKLKEDLVDTLRAQKAGVGISSVQIGSPVRLFIIEIKPTPSRPDLEHLGPIFFFNPETIKKSDNQIKMYEACLSINNADLYGNVERIDSVSIQYLDENGIVQSTDYTGFLARVILHELDHLDGKLFTDRAEPESLMDGGAYRRMNARKK